MVQAHVIIRGDVVGVGFRSYIKNNALNLNLTGWVKNIYTPQNAVEAVFQGKKEDINKMIELCKKGPEVSWVKSVKIHTNKAVEGFDEFIIIS